MHLHPFRDRSLRISSSLTLLATALTAPAWAEPDRAEPDRAEPDRALSPPNTRTSELEYSAPDTRRPAPYATRPSLMLGLMQWAVFRGGNIAGQVKFGRFVAEYSHGQALSLPSFALTGAERDAGVRVSMPWTTGGGFGVQITPNLHLLVEAKLHRYRVEDEFGGRMGYTSFTLGPGLFYDLYLWKGLFLQPNVRWWPTLASSYDASKSLRADDGSDYRPKRHDLTPFVNVNLGWTFDGK